MLYKVKYTLLNIYQSNDFIVGIRAGTGNYQELSSIYEYFPKTKPHKQGRIENYREFRHAYVGVNLV